MECVERGLVSKAELGDLDLRFGNHPAMVERVRRIGNRQGLGDLLAEGTQRAAEKIGGNSIHFAMQVKGMETPAGPAKGQVVELDILLKDYYRARGWDENGVATFGKLQELGLEEEGRAALSWKKA